MTVTPVLADQLEADGRRRAPARVPAPRSGSSSCEADVADVEPPLRDACRAEAERYRAALARLESLDGDLLRAVRRARPPTGRVELLASAATHAVLPLLATRAGPPAADRRRPALAPAPLRRAARASGFPSAPTSPGSSACWPSAGSSYFCTDQSAHEDAARRRWRRSPPRAGPVAFTIDWEAVAVALVARRLSRPTRVYADFHRKSLRGARPWAIGGEPYDPERGRGACARARRASSPPRSPRGCERFAAERGRRGPDRVRDRHRAARPLVVGGAGLARGGARGGRASTGSSWSRSARRASATRPRSGRCGARPGARARTCAPGTRPRSPTWPGRRAGSSCGCCAGSAPGSPAAAAERAARELLARAGERLGVPRPPRPGRRLPVAAHAPTTPAPCSRP